MTMANGSKAAELVNGKGRLGAAAAATRHGKGAKALKEEDEAWVERTDPATGRVFFFNLDTQESSYQVPEKVLSSEWEVMKDPGTNKLFFYHKKRGRSQWERPHEGFVSPSKVLARRGWTEVWDADLQRKYWFNSETGESKWVRPTPDTEEELVVDIDEAYDEQGIGDGDWRMMRDNVTDRVFYYNVSSGHSQWERPEQFTNNKVANKEDVARNPWEKLRDPETGRVYFFHREEGVTQWERPADFVDEDDNDLAAGRPGPGAMQPPTSPIVSPSQPGEDEAEWEEIYDPSSDRKFYFNRWDGRSQWENPHEPKPATSTTAPVPPPSSPTGATPVDVAPPSDSDGRTVAKSDGVAPEDSGKAHPTQQLEEEIKEESGKSEKQGAAADTEMEDDAKEDEEEERFVEGAPEWKILHDEASNREYYFNKATGESQWIHPLEAKVIGDGWCELVDEKSQRRYFYNRTTGESRWKLDEDTKPKHGKAKKKKKKKRAESATVKSGEGAPGQKDSNGISLSPVKVAEDGNSRAGTVATEDPPRVPSPQSPAQPADKKSPGAALSAEAVKAETEEAAQAEAEEAAQAEAEQQAIRERQEEEEEARDHFPDDARPRPSFETRQPERRETVADPFERQAGTTRDDDGPRRASAHSGLLSSYLSQFGEALEREEAGASQDQAAPLATQEHASAEQEGPAGTEEKAAIDSVSSASTPVRSTRSRTRSRRTTASSSLLSFSPFAAADAPSSGEGAEPQDLESSHRESVASMPSRRSSRSSSSKSRAAVGGLLISSELPTPGPDLDEFGEDTDTETARMNPPLHPPPPAETTREIPDEFRPDRVFSTESLLGAGGGGTMSPGSTSSYFAASHLAQVEQRPPSARGDARLQGPQRSALASPAPGSPGALLSGYLEKRARHGRQVWQSRWFVLDGRFLRYFESERQARGDAAEIAQHMLAKIDLQQIKTVQVEDDEENGVEFSIHGNGAMGVLCMLRAPSSEQRQVWMERLQECVAVQHGMRAASSSSLSSAASASLLPGAAGPNAVQFARCNRSFAASEPGVLSFAQGDVIKVLRMPPRERWWVGELDQRVGRFLPSHVTLQPLMGGSSAPLNSPAQSPSLSPMLSVTTGAFEPSMGGLSGFSLSGSQRRSSHRLSEDDANTDSGVQRVRKSFSDVERRIEHRRKREELESLIDALGIEPMKRLETYPTERVLGDLQERLRGLNVRNHKLKAEVRGLEWRLETRTILNVTARGEHLQGPNAYLLVRYSKMLSLLQNDPILLVKIASNLDLSSQHAMATTFANSLFDQHSVREDAFEELVGAAIELLWDQGLPSFEALQRGEPQYLLPGLLSAFVERTESKAYLDQIWASVKDDFFDVLVATGDSRVKVVELACILMDTVASDAGLDLLPPALCKLGHMLFEVGGFPTLHRFLFDVVLVPGVSSRQGVVEEQLQLGTGSVLHRRARSRMDMLCTFLSRDVARDEGPQSSAHKLLSRLTSRLAHRVVDDAAVRSGIAKPSQLCDLIVISCRELYAVHLATVSYGGRLPEQLLDVLDDLGEPRRLPKVTNENPFLVLRLPRVHNAKEDAAPRGLDDDVMHLLIKARSKLDTLHESWHPQRDGQLLERLEEDFERAKISFDEDKRLHRGLKQAEQYNDELLVQRQRLQTKLEATSPKSRLGAIGAAMSVPSSAASATSFPSYSQDAGGLVASIPAPSRAPGLSFSSETSEFASHRRPQLNVSDRHPQPSVSPIVQPRTRNLTGASEDSSANPLANLLSTVFNPMNLG